MEQQFQLKFHGRYNLFEQAVMTAEERGWTIKRLEKEFKDRAEREKAQMGSVRRPSKPSISKPSISRPSMSRRR